MDRGKMAGILALLALAGFMAVFASLLARAIPEDNKDLVNISLMALVGFTGTGIGFFLGSSDTNKKKDEVIAALIPPKNDTTTTTTTTTVPAEPETPKT